MTEQNNEPKDTVSYHLDDGEFAGLSFLYVRALLSIVAATFLAVGAVTAPWGIVVVVMIIGSLLILGWPVLLNLPNRSTTRLAMSLVFLLLLAAGIWGSLTLSALAAAFGIVVVFATEMMRPADAFRRLEQLAGTYLGITLLTSATLWIHAANLVDGIRISVMIALISGIVSIFHAFQSRTLEFVSLINGIVVGGASALILSLPWWSGILAGVAVPLAFQLTQRAVADVLRPGRLQANISRTFVPFSALGMVALAIGLLVD
ncbi:hypothetical protein JOD55_000021 [Arcanobacterium pluranimalium]|uniref:hypothetical protein n=1 Tax=Arcanobacterium pluranimalium TaxID=108028 RepID=UPI00195A778B|nr:hypothetical protein [Arcanobacterium pluranimalium]MBM7824194.1 hypothetical protein [Arcanobacterium pluranimalium]